MEENKVFSLLIYRMYRVFISCFIFPIVVLICIALSVHISVPVLKWIIPIVIFIGLIRLLIYFTVSRITVHFTDDKLVFTRNKKLLFNYNAIPTINLSDINAIITDTKENTLHGIMTKNGNSKLRSVKPNLFFKSDTKQFIDFLKSEVNNLKIKDEFDLWAEKGYLIWAYHINTTLLVLIPLVTIIASVAKGGKPKRLLLLFVILPNLIFYQIKMKQKLKQHKQ